MALTTYSKFYYNYIVTTSNNAIDFDEGGGELQATLNVGSYTLTTLLTEIKRAMDTAGGQAYTVTVSRSTRIITIAASSNFSLLISSGSRIGISAFTLLGFTGTDVSGANTYDGDTASGTEFKPQFYLQDYIPSTDEQEAVDASVNVSSSGKTEVILFGTQKLITMNIRYQTDLDPTGHVWIRTQASAVANLRSFMQYVTGKNPVEFMPDEDSPNAFEKVLLESTLQSRQGVGYRLIERYEDDLQGYYDTGVMIFRVID